MTDVRVRLITDVRGYIARARGTARAELARAQQAFSVAHDRREKTRHTAEEISVCSASQRGIEIEETTHRHRAIIHDLARKASDTAIEAVSNPVTMVTSAASADWDVWQPTPTIANRHIPLLRIGKVVSEEVDIPALIPFLDRSHLVLVGNDQNSIDTVITTLLTRALGTVPAGAVRILGYDPGHLGNRLASFAPLTSAGLLEFTGPRKLDVLLDGLVEEVHRISHRVLVGEHGSLRERAERLGGRPEPWRVAVLLGDGITPTSHERAQIRRLLRTGVSCGVHLIISDLPFGGIDRTTGNDVISIDVGNSDGGERATISGYPHLAVTLDDPPPSDIVTALTRDIADQTIAGPPPASLKDLLPDDDHFWQEKSITGLVSVIGHDVQGNPATIHLGDHPPHALIGGPTGSGKTNFIYAWIAGLTSRYSPDELELYLLDFKEGVSFARFAPTRRSPEWLPHVRLVGLNVNTDREFGIALLRHLSDQLRLRAEAAKHHGVTKLSELREEDTEGRWPRIVVFIDEFQVLFSGRDALTNQAVELLEDLVRRGRSQGIHLILASQDVAGIEALWGRSALLAQLTLRIALPKARRILADTNSAADEIPRYHAVVNTDSGVASANQIVRIPDAGDRDLWSTFLSDMTDLWHSTTQNFSKVRVFDGDAVPPLHKAPDFVSLRPATRTPVALLGAAIDVVDRSISLPLNRVPGRNLAVLGTSRGCARAILDSTARSLARQYKPGQARFSVALLDSDDDTDDKRPPISPTARAALPPDTQWYDANTIIDLLESASGDLDNSCDIPHFILLYAVDAVTQRLAVASSRGSGHEHLRRLINRGPERHTHIMGWWRSMARLREDLGGITARFDAIGSWVALDIHGSELAPLCPTGAPSWYPRPWRALFFDRSYHRTGEIMIPYREER